MTRIEKFIPYDEYTDMCFFCLEDAGDSCVSCGRVVCDLCADSWHESPGGTWMYGNNNQCIMCRY